MFMLRYKTTAAIKEVPLRLWCPSAQMAVSCVSGVRRRLTPQTESQKPYCSSWLYAVHHHSASGTLKWFLSLSIFIVGPGEVCLTRLELCFNPFNRAHPVLTTLKSQYLYPTFQLLSLLLLNYLFFILRGEQALSQQAVFYLDGGDRYTQGLM